MERPIMRSTSFLSRICTPAGPEDLAVAKDLKDTLLAHADNCAGMAANMVGADKCIIVFKDALLGAVTTMFNPRIVHREGPYHSEEGCLSVQGSHKVVRYRTIVVLYQDRRFKEHQGMFSGWTAQIIQHEIDHCRGILV